MSTYVIYMAEKPPPMQEKCLHETLFPEQFSNRGILQQWMGGIFKENLKWAVDMVGPLDVACSYIVSM